MSVYFAFVSKPQNCFHLLRFTTNKYISITTYHARQTPVFSTSDTVVYIGLFLSRVQRGYSVTANRSHECNDSDFFILSIVCVNNAAIFYTKQEL